MVTNPGKTAKLVGSKLGTKEDIANRKKLTNLTFHTVKAIIQDKKTTHSVKKLIYSSLIESIFLYNSELWTLNKEQEHSIDVFQRQMLRKILNK